MAHFERGAIMRTPSAEVRAGGKGIDAARVAHCLGKHTRLIVPLGNLDGGQFRALLDDEGIDYRYSTYDGSIRVATMYHEINSPTTTIVNEEGPTITQKEWRSYLAKVERELAPGEIVASMGSFPQGVTEENVKEFIELVHQNASLIFFDTAPHFMKWAIAHGADIISPNLDEAEAVIGGAPEDLFHDDATNGRARAEAAALKLCELGAKVAIVHAGALGSALAANQRTFFVPQVPVVVASAVGAGDSLAAGFVLKSEEQGSVTMWKSIDWKLSLEFGSATAAAACEKGRSGDVDPKRVEELFIAIQSASDQ